MSNYNKIEIAQQTNSIILSLDSLSVYKEIDIASAKPTTQERGDIVHFGIDEVFPDEKFDVTQFFECYKNAKQFAKENKITSETIVFNNMVQTKQDFETDWEVPAKESWHKRFL